MILETVRILDKMEPLPPSDTTTSRGLLPDFARARLLRFSRISFLMQPNMRTVKTLFFVCIVSLVSPVLPQLPPLTNDVNQVIQAALQPSPLEANLRRLTDEIGGRVPGTLAMQHAVAVGHASVHGGRRRQRSHGRISKFRTPGRRRHRDDSDHCAPGQRDEGGRRDRALTVSRTRRFRGLGSGARSGEACAGR